MAVDPSSPALTIQYDDTTGVTSMPTVSAQPKLPAILNDKIERAAAYAKLAR